MTLPTLKLGVECVMTNPPKPIGIGVFDGDRMVGVVTLEQFKTISEQLTALETIYSRK